MMTSRNPSREKQHGIHYTPDALAAAVAQRLVRECSAPTGRALVVADPACGDGSLLAAFAGAAEARGIPVCLVGNDLDPEAISRTAERLSAAPDVRLSQTDFLQGKGYSGNLFAEAPRDPIVDVFIANPPYVRTQILGSGQAQELAGRFGLKGRVDLAYAFCMAMVDALPIGGCFAFIVSNKFMTIKAGERLRDFLRQETEILEVWDLGDSKLFPAAVLPCVIFGRRNPGQFEEGAPFRSLYTVRGVTESARDAPECATEGQLLNRFLNAPSGSRVMWRSAAMEIRRGSLQMNPTDRTWLLGDAAVAGVQLQMRSTNARRFADVLKIKVGVKTTNDAVYIRKDWDNLPDDLRPEADLLWPIRMTQDVARWAPPAQSALRFQTLYPFRHDARKRTPVDLALYPGARAYLEAHREALARRKYVAESGRHWWEPWVPHQPWMWQQTRAVFPEIAEQPTFGVDESGVIPNGTLFWMYPLEEDEGDVLRAACAIANSSFAVEYYDMLLGTRLYAGRRRWNAQHVGQLPFPAGNGDVVLLAGLYNRAADAARTGEGLGSVEGEIDRICRFLFAGG